MDIEEYFEFIQIESDYLKRLILLSVRKIVDSGFRQDLFFGPLIEGPTFSGENGEVNEDGYIRINTNRLKQYEENVAMALIAHELAHSHLKHFEHFENSLDKEYEADNLARAWGFDIDKFRQVCGEPFIKQI